MMASLSCFVMVGVVSTGSGVGGTGEGEGGRGGGGGGGVGSFTCCLELVELLEPIDIESASELSKLI